MKLVLRLVPRPLTAAIIASAIPAAIRPYSIAVAPDSSVKKRKKVRFNPASYDSLWARSTSRMGTFDEGNLSATKCKDALMDDLQF